MGRFRKKRCFVICPDSLSFNFSDNSVLMPHSNLPINEKKSESVQLRIQKGGKPVFYEKIINQFGRELGTGGKPPSNF